LQGCLEAVASGPAIAAQATAAMQAGRKSLLQELAAGAQGGVTAEMVFEAATQGDLVAQEILENVGTYLGLAIHGLIMSFDPQLIVLGGGVAQAGNPLLEAVRRALARQATESFVFREMFQPERIQLTVLGKDAGILGAAALVTPE